MFGLSVWILMSVMMNVCAGMDTPQMCVDDKHQVKVKCSLLRLNTELYWFVNDTQRIWAFDFETQLPYRVEVHPSMMQPSEFEMILRIPLSPQTTVGILLDMGENRQDLLCTGVVPHKEHLSVCGPEVDVYILCSVCVMLSLSVVVAGILKMDYDTSRHLTGYKSWLSRRTRYFEPAVKRW
ncbi:membrane protein UL121 [Cercopithecine betaherpesvirus 5]|uniref:Membrane protein UL121 n=1 Tax=Simian cytomegalovirus (strain Colburn) TaxID=50292 RepID=G8XTH5_SCMVC|nr:membrane protein UL121 [Cercopithecine betaherpesvirus 5]AEV80467.1 membrane protein UL121 [Cercopithecine betaherpesvirus 5]